MEIVKNFISNYFNFHYGLGCVIGIVLFFSYLYIMKKMCENQRRSISKKEILCCLVLSVYQVLLVGGTLLGRTIGTEYTAEWVPLWSYYEVFTQSDVALARQIVYNVLVFIPWGFLLPLMWKNMRRLRWIVVSAAGASLVIEILQLVLKLGLFEFDDVFHNAVGAVIGYTIWQGWKRLFHCIFSNFRI